MLQSIFISQCTLGLFSLSALPPKLYCLILPYLAYTVFGLVQSVVLYVPVLFALHPVFLLCLSTLLMLNVYFELLYLFHLCTCFQLLVGLDFLSALLEANHTVLYLSHKLLLVLACSHQAHPMGL